jgi:hypothetical protein
MRVVESPRGLLALFFVLGCIAEQGAVRPRTDAVGSGAGPDAMAAAMPPQALGSDAGTSRAVAQASTPAPASEEPDGNDDPVADDDGPLPAHARFERVGKPPLSLKRICDLKPFAGSLYAAHANQPLGMDGATITRYRPDDSPPFSVAFDWNRPGEPTEGGGAGQGFIRIHPIGGRLFVPDADPPHNGFGISEHGTEGFVFVSDPEGNFARARPPNHRPPATPKPDGGAGAGILPRAYHVLDVIRFRGRLYASTGSVPPTERAWHGASPGALHVASPDLSRWTYEVDYPYPWQNGVWRLTFLVRFRDRLFAGIQDYDGREPNDFVVFNPPKNSDRIERADARAVRVTNSGGAQTIRWFVDNGTLYWIAWTRSGGVRLMASEDGEKWRTVPLPEGLGSPTDIVRYRGSLHVLMESGLVRLGSRLSATSSSDDAGANHAGANREATIVARVEEKKTPFAFDDIFCAAPLAVFRGELYAGGQRGGVLYKVVWE